MPPPLVVAVFHLRLEEASKDSSSSPTHAVTLLYAALDDDLADYDGIEPGAMVPPEALGAADDSY